MIFSISQNDTESLLHLPETGMGFQFIETRFRSEFTFNKVLVLNAVVCIDMDTPYDDLILRKIWQGGLDASNYPMKHLQEVHLLNKNMESHLLKEEEPYLPGKGGAIDAPVQLATGMDHYIRLSAFKDDKRIDQMDKRLLPGSFTTTLPDFMTMMVNRQVPGSAAHMYNPLERYALPSILPISWIFNIQPKLNDEFQQGIVQPAFGRRGGGVECYFAKGTSVNTFIPPPGPFN